MPLSLEAKLLLMTWITTIPYAAATGTLKKIYDRIKGPDNYIDNILLAHSLRPHTLRGHMSLYKNVLHHRQNTLPPDYLETLGVYVSLLNDCDYCVQHHYVGLQRILQDEVKGQAIMTALQSDPALYFDERELEGLRYAAKLTQTPATMSPKDYQQLRSGGLDDGEILEINQVVAYFNYANRMVLGLGIDTTGDKLGLSPSDRADAQNWSHQ